MKSIGFDKDVYVPISEFNKGQASRIFNKVQEKDMIYVMRHNAPAAIILSVEEYKRLKDIEDKTYNEELEMLKALLREIKTK